MAIRLKYEAPGVVIPEDKEQERLGQSLILQQNQQKYLGQQQGYDRLLQVGRDRQQQAFQSYRDGQQIAEQKIRDINQQSFLTGRDKQQNDWNQQNQRAKDFAAAQDRIGIYAQDALTNPDTPHELRQKIRDLVGAKSIAMGRDFNDVQQQEFLKDYNSQLAGYLSQIPPPKPKPSAQDQFDQGVVTDPETGMRYRQNPKGGWDELKQPEKRPTSAAEAFQADPKTEARFMDDAKNIVTEGGSKLLDEAGYKKAVELSRKLWEQNNSPTPIPSGIQPATIAPPQVPRTERSILEQAPSGIPVAPPDQGQPPSPPAAPQAVPIENASRAEYDAYMTSKGYKLVTPSNGGRPYYESPAAPTLPPEPTQNNLTDVATGGAAPSEGPTPEFEAAQKQLENNGMKVPGSAAGQPAAAPDFGSLASSAKDDADRAVLGKLQGVYEQAQSPEIQSAIGVLVNPDATPPQKVLAARALKAAGIDLDQLTAPPPPPPSTKDATRETMRKKYGESYDSF